MAQIYGIDLACEKFDVSFINEEGKQMHLVVKNQRSNIEKFLDKLSRDAWIVAEHTGVYGDLLLYLADIRHIRVCYVSGYEIKHSQGLAKGKSDPADAARIREYGERHLDKLTETHFPSDSMYALRELHATRRLLVQQRKQLITMQEGDKHRPMQCQKATAVKEDLRKDLTEKIKEIEAEMDNIISNAPELRKTFEIAQSIPGIGRVTATELIIKTDNFQRVSTARKCASLAGIAPFPNSTGKSDKGNHVSHMGDMELKSLLYMCATTAVQCFEKMRVYKMKKYDVEHKHHFVVMNNVANKLLRILYALVKSGKMYDPMYLPRDPRLKLAIS